MRPLEGEGVLRRVAPFIAAIIITYAGAVFVHGDDGAWDLLAAGLLIPLLIGIGYLVPWSRLPAGAQAVPPLGIFLFVGLLRNDSGGQESEFTALLVAPLVWFCLHGSRAQLLTAVGALVATLALPHLLVGGSEYPQSELVRALVTGVIAATLGVTVQQLVATARERESEQRSILASAQESFISMGADGRIREWNRQAEVDFGWSREEALGRPLIETIVPARHRALLREQIEAYLTTGRAEIVERRVEGVGLRADGSEFPVEFTVSPLRTARGVRFSAFLHDISARRAADAELEAAKERFRHQASHDPLTRLPNRGLFDDRMAVALARLRRAQLPIAILFLDLDRFKLVNDGFGHDAGDRLLRQLTDRLRRLVRPSDTVARLGGDEFAILCEEVSPDGAATLARRVGESIAKPFRIAGVEVVVTSSIGIVINRDPDASRRALLADADAAMYEAKTRGRSRYAFFATEMRTRASGRLEMETQLRSAVAGDEITVHFQPQVDLHTRRVIGLEALARWRHPDHGLLPAAEFIPLAEESDLVVAVGGLVLEEAIERALHWRAREAPDLRVTVNVSARQITGPELPAMVAEALGRHPLPPQALCLEMTESAIEEDPEGALEALRDLKDLGVCLSVDEFGLGASTINMMRRLPDLDVLKIDPSFVAALEGNGERELVTAMLGMARALGMASVAEGVESAGQAAALLSLGCEAAQGHYISHPLPSEEVAALLASPILGSKPPA